MIDWSGLPSQSQLRQVGKRLAAGTATDQDFTVLGQYQRLADEVARDATTRLRADLLGECQRRLDVQETGARMSLAVIPGRAKTTRTLVDKLKRMPTYPLGKIRDVAGVRVVVEGGMDRQDLVCDVAVHLLHDPGLASSRAIDHRDSPVFGYRALHAEVRFGRMPLEIQVRTAEQEAWANLFESSADDGDDRSARGPA